MDFFDVSPLVYDHGIPRLGLVRGDVPVAHAPHLRLPRGFLQRRSLRLRRAVTRLDVFAAHVIRAHARRAVNAGGLPASAKSFVLSRGAFSVSTETARASERRCSRSSSARRPLAISRSFSLSRVRRFTSARASSSSTLAPRRAGDGGGEALRRRSGTAAWTRTRASAPTDEACFPACFPRARTPRAASSPSPRASRRRSNADARFPSPAPTRRTRRRRTRSSRGRVRTPTPPKEEGRSQGRSQSRSQGRSQGRSPRRAAPCAPR